MAELRTERKAGYRGRWKKWLLIYLGVGAVAYLIIYLVFFHSGGYGGGGGGYALFAPSLSPLLLRRSS